MWPFSQPKCPVCKGALAPHSGTIGHAAYRCPTCIKNAKRGDERQLVIDEIDAAISYNRATVNFYTKEGE